MLIAGELSYLMLMNVLAIYYYSHSCDREMILVSHSCTGEMIPASHWCGSEISPCRTSCRLIGWMFPVT